ncbi:MAG: helix-turn-helix transcriptional regulator [Erysipelotrichaceae bacterium]|nr:helix-turn-helix transcriptional regulator [Erysipelotrichaceae bacterium]
MENIELFSQILQCIYQIYLWIYDQSGDLIKSDSSQEWDYSALMSREHLQNISRFFKDHSKPMIYTANYQTNWIADWKKTDEGPIVVLIGPFFLDSFPKGSILEEMERNMISLKKKDRILSLLNMIPVIGFTRIMEYAVMVHYALSQEQISASDLHFNVPENRDDEYEDDEVETTIHGTYEAEREMLRMVREGDLRLEEYMKTMASIGNIGKMANDDSEPLRQMRNALIVQATLFCRAAIEGGLYADTAMTLTDHYFQSIEAAKSFQDLADIALAVEKDFVGRTHKIRQNKEHSRTIRHLIDYIDLHLEEEISLQDMALEFGYSEYYLSKKFKKETKQTPKEFIRDKRLERAAFYLTNTDLSINSIAAKLHFSSQSYFNTKFKEKFGQTPSEYQKKI